MTYFEEYRDLIHRREIIVGQEMWQELDNLYEDLQKSEYKYDTTKSDSMIDFMQNCIRLTKSPFYNKPMILMPWQKAWIEVLYSFKMYDAEIGKWLDRFTETLLLIARKNTKSETSSALCDTEMCVGGEGMDIVCASNTYDQSDILYEACDTMRTLIDPSNKDTWRNIKGLRCLYNNNKITKISERTRAKEGRNIDIAVVDECHEMLDNSLVEPLVQSMSIKENKKLIMITTEGLVNEGFLDDKLKEYRKIISGEDRTESAKRKLPWLYTQDSESEVWETNEDGINPAWQKSNPTLIYGVKKWSYLRDQVEEARKSKAKRVYVLSKDFNFKVSNSAQWLDRSVYDYESGFDLEDFRDSVCIGAVDLSETTDMTCAKIMLCKKGDKQKYVVSHYWIPESKLQNSDDSESGAKYQEWAERGMLTICEGNDNDLSLVADWFFSFSEKYNIRLIKCGYDQRFKRDWVQRMEYYGWVDKEDLIMILQSPEVLHIANCQVEADLTDKLLIGNNEIDKWCFGNAALKVNSQGKSLLVKVNNQKSKRIDGAVASVILQETYNRYKIDLNEYL